MDDADGRWGLHWGCTRFFLIRYSLHISALRDHPLYHDLGNGALILFIRVWRHLFLFSEMESSFFFVGFLVLWASARAWVGITEMGTRSLATRIDLFLSRGWGGVKKLYDSARV